MSYPRSGAGESMSADYDKLGDDLKAALDAGDQIRLRGIVRDELGEPLFGDLEQWMLMAAMGLPDKGTSAGGVLDRIKAKCGDDIGALLCMAMAKDLELSARVLRLVSDFVSGSGEVLQLDWTGKPLEVTP